MHALTTFELRDYRRELEAAIAFFDQQDPVPPARADLQAALDEVMAEQDDRRGWPMPDPGRVHDVSALTAPELERARRELQAALALARPGSPAQTPILAHMAAIDAELASRADQASGPDQTCPCHLV